MTRFNAWNVFKNGLNGQTGWDRQWRDPEPKQNYDAVIVGGGLHGLATAYYLAKEGAIVVGIIDKNGGIINKTGYSFEEIKSLLIQEKRFITIGIVIKHLQPVMQLYHNYIYCITSS